MTYVVEVLRQEHRNIEKLLRILERELSVFDRGNRPNYEVVLGVIDYFKDYPDSCHHPKEDIIFEKLQLRDSIGEERLKRRRRKEGTLDRLSPVCGASINAN
jgi:hemerythrin-like domain-containing protein